MNTDEQAEIVELVEKRMKCLSPGIVARIIVEDFLFEPHDESIDDRFQRMLVRDAIRERVRK